MTKKHHDQIAGKGRSQTDQYTKSWFQKALALLRTTNIPNGLNVLDLGCGNGEFAEIMLEQFQAKVVCVDYSEAHLERTRAKGFETHALNLEVDELLDSQFYRNWQGQFDLIVMLEVIEHIFDTNELLQFAHALLKSQGQLLISTPNLSFTGFRLYSLVNGNIPFGDGHHVRYFDERRLCQHLFVAGFDTPNRAVATYQGNWPLNRICTQRSHIPFAIGKIFDRLFAHSPFRYLQPASWRDPGLVIMVQREDVPSLSLAFQTCEVLLAEADENTRRQMIARLKEAKNIGLLYEHPMLNAYVNGLQTH